MKRLAMFTAALSLTLTLAGPVAAQNQAGTTQAEANTEALPEVQLSVAEVTARKDTINYITSADMERKSSKNLWEALRGALGVNLGYSGSRNEGQISIRGGNRMQIGMYIDDMPIATAYRNEYNISSALTFDLESVEISKGYSSPHLTNNNSLVAAVNLRTAKPTKEFEYKVKYSNFFDRTGNDQGRFFGLSLGSAQEKFYFKATVVADDQDFFTMPSGVKDGFYQKAGRRNNSDYQNRRLAFMFGLTPTEDVDIRFGLEKQRFERGQPINATDQILPPLGFGGKGDKTTYNRFPVYNNDRYYMNANVDLNEKAHLKLLVYADQHKDEPIYYKSTDLLSNNIVSDNNQYGPYDQYTTGTQLKLDYTFNEANKLSASVGFRQLSHKDYITQYYTGKKLPGAGDLNREMKENYWDFGLEYNWKPIDPLTLVAGVSFTKLDPKTITFISDKGLPTHKNPNDLADNFGNYQLGAFYDLNENHQLFATVAKKARPGSMRERFYINKNTYAYSNLDLKKESAMHYEFGYRGTFDDWLTVNSSVYYSDVKDKIVQSRDSGGDTMFVNVARAKTHGLEVGLEATVNQYFRAGANLSLMDWKTETPFRSESLLTDSPKAQGSIYAVISPMDGLSIIPQVNASSSFYTKTDPDQSYEVDKVIYQEPVKAPGFATADLKMIYDVTETISLEVGAKNIFDKTYYYDWFYPEAGRTYFVGLNFQN